MTALPMWHHRVEREDQVSVVSLSGELDMAASAQLRELLLNELAQPGVPALTIDLADVAFLDSAALNSLLAAYLHAQDHGQHCRVVNPVRPVRRVFEVTGLFDLLITGQQPQL